MHYSMYDCGSHEAFAKISNSSSDFHVSPHYIVFVLGNCWCCACVIRLLSVYLRCNLTEKNAYATMTTMIHIELGHGHL